MRKLTKAERVLFLLLAVAMIATGFCDIDSQMNSYKWDNYWRSQNVWQFAPWLQVNWWWAYVFSVLRLVVGAFIVGWICKDLMTDDSW